MPIILLIDPTRGFHTWNIDEIYEGTVDPSKVNVPNVGDMVIAWDEGVYKVDSVGVDNIPVLTMWDPDSNIANAGSGGLITSLSEYQPSVINRAFLDTSDVIYYITIDNRWRSFGSESTDVKLYRGTDISAATGIVLSREYSGMVVIGDSQPLLPLTGTTDEKRPPAIPVEGLLNDGETVTLVTYTATGRITGTTTFVVVNSSAIAPLNSTTKTIVDILLLSEWITTPDPDLLLIPANIGLRLAGATGRILYHDGTTEDIPIDGVKLVLHGANNFNNNMEGSVNYLVLTYYADTTERLINGGAGRHISHTYYTQTFLDDIADSYKVYLMLSYNNLNDLYSFTFYLTNSDYTLLRKLLPGEYTAFHYDDTVPPGVSTTKPLNLNRTANISLPKFTLNIAVHMEQIFPMTYDNYTFTQQMFVDLNDITPSSQSWVLDYEMDNVNTFNGAYKAYTRFSYDYEDLDLRVGAVSQADWLDKIFRPISPIYVSPLITYPEPTHFRIMYDTVTNGFHTSDDIDIADWDVIYNPGDVIWKNNTGFAIVWLRDEIGLLEKHVLGMTPVMIVSTAT